MAEEEINLLEFFRYVSAEMHDLRESIDKLTATLESLKNEPITTVGSLLYDYVEELKELRKLFKWYIEVSTRREVE